MMNITTKDIEKLGKSDQRRLRALLNKIGNKDMSKIKIKIEDERCTPERTHRFDAAHDLKTKGAVSLAVGESQLLHTGVQMEIPARYCGLVVVRSSVGKKGITMTNSVGVIDSEYRGEIMVNVVNNGKEAFNLDAFERFAQILIVPVNLAEFWVVDNLSNTGRGSGGFGSTNELEAKAEILGDLVAKELEKMPDEVLEELSKLIDLQDMPVSKYMQLKNSGKLKELYPEATGVMKEDLNG